MSPASGNQGSSQWHAVTPQTRPLSISILELAPTSVTLALTRSPPTSLFSASGSSQSSQLATTQHIVHSLAHHSHSYTHLAPHSHLASGPSQSNGQGSGASKKKKKKRGGAGGGGGGGGGGVGQGGGGSGGSSGGGGSGGGSASGVQQAAGESDEGAEEGEDESGSGGQGVPGAYPYSSVLGEGQTFKDMLSHGVVITLDGLPWSRIVAHVRDDADDEDIPGSAAGAAEGDGDDEGDWEDEWDQEAQEDVGDSSSGASVTRRRRKRRPSASPSEPPRSHLTKSGRSQDHRQDRNLRWDRERAVVVVYDLDPSKEHEIELQIVGLSREVKESMVPVSNAVLIPPASQSSARSRANSLRSRSRPRSRSNSVNTQGNSVQPSPGPSPLATEVPSSPGRSPSPIPDQPVAIPTSILSPHDAQTAQTRHLIAAALAEREHLQVQIKEARKTAQRSEAALRTEIESMKKSNEKAGSNDQRNKQKSLALQEQVKQAWAAAESANQGADEVNARIPDLKKKLKDTNEEVGRRRAEWKDAKENEEEARESEKRNRAEEDKQLAELSAKIDKLRLKKEKKEAEQTELRKKLDELEKAREEVLRKSEEEKNMRRQGYYPGMRWDQGSNGAGTPGATSEFGPGFDSNRVSPAHAGPNFSSGPSFRPRGGFPSRFQSNVRPLPSQGTQSFYDSNSTTPWNSSPKATASVASGIGSRGPLGTGPNPTAAPFKPSNYQSSGPSPPGPESLHTALMPAHMQHRIYLPNSVRPRPAPNFHPPPSVLAEQAQSSTGPSNVPSAALSANKSSGISAPAFPPLPGANAAPGTRPSPTSGSAGPSLASIVTRAVLAPTSSALAQGGTAGPGSGRKPRTASGSSVVAPSVQQSSLGPQGQRSEFPPLSPTAALFTGSPARTTPPRTTPPPAPWGAVGTAAADTPKG